MMPNDPKWMHGARSCSAIAEAICRKYGIERLIPSDSNTVHGAIRQEFRRVTLSGSFRKHLDYILSIKRDLEKQGVQVLSPRFVTPKNPGDEFVVFDGEDGKTPLQLERHPLDSIDSSDALIVCNPGGYVGASAMIEVGYAHSVGKHTIFVEKPEEFMLNTLPADVGI
jgi:nucleoside 2-deoxyribosyltransferase